MVSLDVLVCTVGTSLIYPNMESLKKQHEAGTLDDTYASVASAYVEGKWDELGRRLCKLDAQDKTCGAEINSTDSMVKLGFVNDATRLFFLHSDTNDGRNVARVLCAYYGGRAQNCQIESLQDVDPREFRTKGLRNLAKQMCRILLEHRGQARGINATGGYKAQIAVAALIGQAVGVPVFYKHERFDDIIQFPPMPVALDFEYWMKASGVLFDLAKTTDIVAEEDYAETVGDDERIEALIERVEVDGQKFVELSPVGQIFHETFRDRFSSLRDEVVPQAVPDAQKKSPRVERSGHVQARAEVLEFMRKVTYEVPFVKQCSTWYFNPDLAARTHFRKGATGIECVFSNGTYTAKFCVQTSANTEGQVHAAVAELNAWLHEAC